MPVAQEITVEATGRTLDPIDLAAFVQPEFLPPPAPAPPVTTGRAQRLRGGRATEARRPRRSRRRQSPCECLRITRCWSRSAAAGRSPRPTTSARCCRSTPSRSTGWCRRSATAPTPARRSPPARVRRPSTLAQSTVTGEDPAQPPCPSLGTVWRRVIPALPWQAPDQRVRLRGDHADRLRRHVSRSGRTRSTASTASDAARSRWSSAHAGSSRSGSASAAIASPPRRRCCASPPGANATVIDGGPGGSDPTAGGPGRGFPGACRPTAVERARITGPRLSRPRGTPERLRARAAADRGAGRLRVRCRAAARTARADASTRRAGRCGSRGGRSCGCRGCARSGAAATGCASPGLGAGPARAGAHAACGGGCDEALHPARAGRRRRGDRAVGGVAARLGPRRSQPRPARRRARSATASPRASRASRPSPSGRG